MTTVLTLACKDCGKLFYGAKLSAIDEDVAEEIRDYRDEGHAVDVQHGNDFDFGCECNEE